MKETVKNTALIKNLTLFFGIFLLFTDVFFLVIGIVFKMPLMRYVIYVKLVINSTNIFLILRKHYLISTSIIYFVILGFMVVGVICTGTASGFQLYALGMLVCISYNGYLHNRILKHELPLSFLIFIHVVVYSLTYLLARMTKPLYEVPRMAIDILISFNSIATFSIVIIYVVLFHNVAIKNEEKLEKMAMIDNLTGLYNRHYLMASLSRVSGNNPEDNWLAIMDIDDFKKVNDTYGHNCGDYVLNRVADIAAKTCKDCTVCRWGGEEFIVLGETPVCSDKVLEELRKKIAEEVFRFEKNEIRITVTIGSSKYQNGMTNDNWISSADNKLYKGKSNGKNQVVY